MDSSFNCLNCFNFNKTPTDSQSCPIARDAIASKKSKELKKRLEPWTDKNNSKELIHLSIYHLHSRVS